MPDLVEYIDSRTFSEDQNGIKTATRIWKALVSNGPTARLLWENNNGKSYPDDDELEFDTLSIQPLRSSAGFLVTAYYTNAKRPYWWTIGKRAVTVDIPINILERKYIGSPSTTTPVSLWGLRKYVATTSRPQRILSFRLLVRNITDLDVITLKENALHTIRGTKYHFIAGEYEPDRDFSNVGNAGDTWYKFRYTWEYDPGTKRPDLPNSDTLYISPPPGASANMLRMPYTRLEPVPPTTPRGYWTTLAVPVTHEDANGWQQLPGAQFI